MWRLIVLLLVVMAGFWFGKGKKEPATRQKKISLEFPTTPQKSFVIALYTHNQAGWCKRALRSIFEQDYPSYRVVMIDDGSIDGTENVAKDFIIENNQDEKVIFIRNEKFLGFSSSLNRVIDHCQNEEVVIPLNAKDWFTSPYVLHRFNEAYQNPDVWVVKGQGLEYPTYKMCSLGATSFYAALFKEATSKDDYLATIQKLASGKTKDLEEPLQFLNLTRPSMSPVFLDTSERSTGN